MCLRSCTPASDGTDVSKIEAGARVCELCRTFIAKPEGIVLLSLVNCVVCTRVPDSSSSTNFFPGCENFSRYVREFTSYTFARRRPVSFARSSVTAARRSSSVIRSAGRAGSTRALTSQTRTGDKGANPHAAHVSPWLLQEITGWVQPQAQQTGTPCATEMCCFTANQC